jgi:DNA-binding NtrC family response regulator
MNRILIIEDDRKIRQFVMQVLHMEGYDVIAVSSGNEALAFLEQDDRFDLIVTDLLMSDGGGVSFIKTLQQTYFDIPIVLMSAHITRHWPEEAIRRTSAQLIKPFVAHDLCETVNDVLMRQQEAAQR